MNDYKLFELNNVENFFYYSSLRQDELVNGIIITNYFKIDDDLIKNAIYYLYKRHPLFRAHLHVDQVTKKTYFAIPNKIDDKLVNDMKFEKLKLESRENLEYEIEKFSVKLLDYDNKCLLWRLQVIEYEHNDNLFYAFTLLLPMYMTDGINITTLCIELINIINSLLNGHCCNEMSEQLEIADNLIDIIKNYNLAENYRVNYEKLRKNKPEIQCYLPHSFMNFKDSGYGMKLLSLDSIVTKNIVLYAKNNNIKVNSILTAAFYYTLKELYEENQIKIQKDLKMYVMVNLRFRVEPNIDFSHVRAFVCGLTLNLEYPEFGKYDNFLNECRHIENLVEINIENQSIFDWLLNSDDENLIFKKFDLDEIYKEFDKNRSCDFVMSNTGTWVAKRKTVINGPLKINELYYGDSLNSYPTINIPFIIHMHTFNDRLMIQLSTNRTKINKSYSDRFIVLFEKFLKNTFI